VSAGHQYRVGDHVVYTGEGVRHGVGSWLGAPTPGTRGKITRVLTPSTAGRGELEVAWSGSQASYPVMVADIKRAG
jgi:hypothetical protein